MKTRKIIMIFLSLAIIGGIILYANPSRVAETLAGCNLYYIILAFAAANAALLLRALKWKVLLEKVPFVDVMNIQFFGIAVSNMTPGKIGEPVKSIALKMLRGIHVSTSLPSVIWERIFDVFVMLLFGIIGIYLIASMQYFIFIEVSMAFFIILLVFLMAVLLSKKFGKKIFGAARKLPVMNMISDQFVDNFYSSKIKKRNFALCFILTAAAWFCDGMVFYIVLLSINPAPLNASMPLIMTSILSLSIFAGLLTSLPGGVGGTEAVMIVIMGAIGIGSSVAASVALIGRVLTFFYSIALGYVSFLFLSRKINTKEILKEIGF